MRIVAISDTHRAHMDLSYDLEAIGGDVLIHAGDSGCFSKESTYSFFRWLTKMTLHFGVVITTFGNHDVYAQGWLDEIKEDFETDKLRILVNERFQFQGLNFWGSPYSQTYGGGENYNAFSLPDSELAKLFSMVPPDTDILITHTPPFSILDRHHGSRALMDRLAELNVRLSLFGHIHECHGFTIKGHTTFVNASSIGTIDSGPWLPIIIDLSEDSIEVQAPRHLPLT